MDFVMNDNYMEFRSVFLKEMGFEELPQKIPAELETAIQQVYDTVKDAAERCHVFLEPSLVFRKPQVKITDNRNHETQN